MKIDWKKKFYLESFFEFLFGKKIFFSEDLLMILGEYIIRATSIRLDNIWTFVKIAYDQSKVDRF